MITQVRKNGGHQVVFHAEEQRKLPEYFGEVPFFSGHLWKSEKMQKCLQKPLWAKWLRMLGENEGRHVIFHAEKHGKRPEYLEEVKNVFFPGTLMWRVP